MFSNLSQGSILYVLDTKDKYNLSTGQITSITPPKAKFATFNPYGQAVEYVVDIIANVNGERREFKQVPSNLSIANFGSDVFTLADSRESMLSHIENLYQTHKSNVDNYEKDKLHMEDCENIKLQLNPSLAAIAQRDSAMQTLETKVDYLTEQFSKVLSVLNKETSKPE